MDELRDIKPVVEYAPGIPWWVYALAAFAACAIAVVVWLRRRARRPTPVVVDPNRAALVSLSALKGMTPRDRVSAERLQTQVSMVLRRWVETRWGIRATDMTTEEIAANVSLHAALGQEKLTALLGLLAFADGVRFAGVGASEAEHRTSVERAYALVAQP